MFRIECFCDDKNLPKILWALTELGAYNVVNVPVTDTKPKPKKLNGHARTPKAELPQRFLAYIKQHKLKEVRAPQVREFVTSIGWSEASYSHALNVLRDAGAVAKVSGAGDSAAVWRITPSKVKKPKKPRATP